MDPFEVLGVGRDASPGEIRRAFAAAVRAAHPDSGGSTSSAPLRVAELIRARDLALEGGGIDGRVEIYHRPGGVERVVRLVTGRRPRRPARDLL